MFDYELPKWKFKLDTKTLSIVLLVVYLVTTLPLLIIGHYNFPSADDLSMAYRTHEHYLETGSVIGTVFYAITVAVDQYFNWIGYYFSAALTDICPGIFGEKWYFLTTYVMLIMMTLGVWYFFDALVAKALKGDKYLASSMALSTLTVIVQCMEEGTTRVEAFYWYSGAINYMFMFGLGMFWIGLLIRAVFDEERKSRIRKLIGSSVLGFCLGGANYMTALELFICSFLILFICMMVRMGKMRLAAGGDKEKERAFTLLLIPAILNIFGFGLSCLAPGNSMRGSSLNGFGPIKAIFTGLFYTLDICMTGFTRWEYLIFILILAVISWKAADGIDYDFRHPFVFAVFAYGMVSAPMVPPLYAMGSVEAGRIRSIVWAGYVVMTALTVFYLIAWAKKRILSAGIEHDTKFSAGMTFMLSIAVLFLLFGSALSVHVDEHYYLVSSAVYDLANGNASRYAAENAERVKLYLDDSVRDVVVAPHADAPKLLFFTDVTKDREDWINSAAARYYHKDSVVLGE